ncbi:lamin tail domain-containing protein [Sorangium sp. So ce1153]|uniref:lamin tail domain-containing protein n=1 Tax=Sorangium sp. So ce1153 TaxID=3133333 RepID=UPI003F64707F
MHKRNLLSIALLAASPLALAHLMACGGDDATGGGGASSSSTTSSTTGEGGGGGGGGETGGGGAGGEGGAGGGDGGAGGEVSGEAADHLLISEVVVAPGAAEFIEIWNPTDAEIDLTNYYLSDNTVYYLIAAGEAWNPNGSAGTDFLVQFPAGTVIPAGAHLVLASHDGFELEYDRCADFALDEVPIPCGGDDVPPMLAPANGALGAQSGGLLTGDGEMVILFEWDGTEDSPVRDVDYVIWGEELGNSEMAYKTGKTGYADDTSRSSQRAAAVAGDRQSITRCGNLEYGELLTEGNGITGHDETSEWLDISFKVSDTPSPGEASDCE